MAQRLKKDQEWFDRAERVIPGGVYGHQAPQYLVEGEYPRFLNDAEGCRVRDADGNEYIDYLCAYGPMVVGYHNPRVDEAYRKQNERCGTGNLPATNMVELAERLTARTPGMDWAMFAKGGSDVCTWSLAVARQATGRDLVVMAAGTYHGVHGWCNGPQFGFPDGDRNGVLTFEWNDGAALERLFAENPGRIAAVILTPFRHEAGADSVMPAEGFLAGVRKQCTDNASVFIVDDVRAGFRLHAGGSAQRWGVTPDMTLYSKALGNGYPVSAMLGCDALRRAAEKVFYTGTFWSEAASMSAAITTLEEMDRCDAIAHMDRMGVRLRDGLSVLASEAGVEVRHSGPPSIPFMTFPADRGSFERSRIFAGTCAREGVFLHPTHNWFTSAAHTEADIDRTLEAARVAFAAVREV